jgi:hypothetical protein
MLNKLAANMNKSTPSWAGRIRNIALACVAGAGAILVSPLSLPAAIITAAGYVSLSGSVIATIMQAFTVSQE